jgi:signal transduction histidine kinase
MAVSAAGDQPEWLKGGPRLLEQLTGVRSGKRSFYPAYVSSAERLERVIHALDGISRALVRTASDQESLVRTAVLAAADHLPAEYVLFAVSDDALPQARPRYTIVGPAGRVLSAGDSLPEFLRNSLEEMLAGRLSFDEAASAAPAHHLRIPVRLAGEVVGGLLAWTASTRPIEPTDEAVLRILASQSVVALHNSSLHRQREALLERTEQLYTAAQAQAAELAARNEDLQRTQEELLAARAHEVIDAERHRIARELHDSVTQSVLSAGMQVELCRNEESGPALQERLDTAKDLTGGAVDALRSVIHALNHDTDPVSGGLPAMLERLRSVHLPAKLAVDLRVEGRPLALPARTEHSLVRICGEALFNAAVHGGARRAVIRLVYRPQRVTLSITDDGSGDPETLRGVLRASAAHDVDGAHRGLVNMRDRAGEVGGSFRIRRARAGGVAIQVGLPTGG